MRRKGLVHEALFYAAGLVVYIIVAAACGLTLDEWTDTDTYFAASGLALFVLGLFLARRQGQLQGALADLETEEKINVLFGHAAGLRDDHRYDAGFTAVGDALACLKVVGFTTSETRGHYSSAARAALDQLETAVRERSPFTPEEIARLITATQRITELIERLPPSVRSDVETVKEAADRLLIALRNDPRRTTVALEGAPISIVSFMTALQDHVQAQLDFTRLNDADFRTRARVIRDPVALVGWFSPWYLDGEGNECDHLAEGAVPIPMVRPDGSPIPPPPSHAEDVARISRSMRMGRPGPILIGGYRPFGRDVVVVVDGNHRLRATLANGGPLSVVALILHGPDDPAILSDLAAV